MALIKYLECEKELSSKSKHCLHYGSTQSTSGQRGLSFWTGFIGVSKIVNCCVKCGYHWTL